MLSAGGLRFPKLQGLPEDPLFLYRLDWEGFPRLLPEHYERELEEAVFMFTGDDDELATITRYACRASEEATIPYYYHCSAYQEYVKAAFSFLQVCLRRPDHRYPLRRYFDVLASLKFWLGQRNNAEILEKSGFEELKRNPTGEVIAFVKEIEEWGENLQR